MAKLEQTKERPQEGASKVRKMIIFSFTLLVVAIAAILVGMMFTDEDSDAAVNDTFTVDGLTYKVLTESGETGTVSVSTNASDLTDVVIPDTVLNGESSVVYSVTKIAASGFSGKTTITSVTIGSNVTEIENNAFQGCTGLTTFTIPNTVTTIGGTAILKGVNLQTLTVDSSSSNCNHPLGCNPVSIIFTDNVSTIYYGYIGPDTTSVTIGSNVSKINNGALNYKEETPTNAEYAVVTRLTSITNNSPYFELSGGILYKKSGSNYTEMVAMLSTDETVNITIPETVTLCHAGLFANKTIGTITWNSGTTYIPSAMFYGCTFTTDFSVPNVTYISSYAFQDATFTENFTVPSTSTAQGKSFKGATFEKAFIFNGITTIGQNAFEGAAISSFTLSPSAALKIYPQAFKNATINSAFTIPSNVTFQYYSSPLYCDIFRGAHLTNVTVEMPEIERRGFYEANIETLTLSSNVATIGDYAFYRANIGSAVIPSTITSFGSHSFDSSTLSTADPLVFNGEVTIGSYAFQNTGLTAIQFQSMADTSSIGEKAFYNSSSIHEIKFLGTILPAKVGTNAFDTRYSVNGDLFSMKVVQVVDDEGNTETNNEDIAALKTGDKFGSTAINTSAGNVLNLEKDYEFKPTGDLAWSYNHTTGVLTLSVNDSTTAMKSYDAGLAPWNSLKPYVTEIVVNDGVTSVSLEGLSDFPNCTKLTIGSSVASFGGANNLVKLEELVFYATNCGSMSTNVLQNMGAESQNGVKVTFQSLSDGVILRVPQNFLNTPSVNVTELVFISAGGLTLQSNSMFFTTHVTKITYDVAGTMTNNSSALSDHLGADEDSLELVIGTRMTSMPGSTFTSSYVSMITINSQIIESIANAAFQNKTRITSIALPSSCVTIGNDAFKGCTALQSFSIAYDESKNITIGQSAFEGCTALGTFDFRNVTSIGSKAFYGCSSLECDANLSKATSIGAEAFSGTSADNAPNLRDVTLVTSVWLGDSAFRYSGASFGTITMAWEYKWGSNGYFFGGCSVEAFIIDYQTTTPSNMFAGITSSYTITLKKTPNDFAISNDKVTSVTVDSAFQWIKVTGDTTSPLRRAFISCTNLTTVNINKSGIVLGAQAFDGCSKLATVNGFDNITEFQGLTFRNCALLFKNADMVEFNGKTFDASDFENTGITAVRLINCIAQCTTAQGVETSSPFKRCSITTLEYSWTSGSIDTTKIWNLMDGVLTDYTLVILGDNIPDVNLSEGYDGGTHLVAVTVSVGVTGSADSARFTGCTNLVTINFDATNLDMGTFTSDGPFRDLKQSITLNLGSNVEIPAYMFKGLNISQAITLADGMVAGDYAFSGSSVTSATIQSGALLGDYVFRDCANLTTASLNAGATIGTGTFYNCTLLASATMTGDANTIPAETFLSCKALKSFTIPSTVTTIGNKAFSSSGLTSIQFPAGLTSIGLQAFYNCVGITSITIPSSVTSIGLNAFWYCVNLTSLTLDDLATFTDEQMLSISNCAFQNTKINSLSLPLRTKAIYASAFSGTKITELNIPENVTTIGGSAFSGTTLLTRVIINSNITSANGAFNGAGSSDGFALILSDNVTTIPTGMFMSSNVSSIQMSGNSLSVGANAFNNCIKLTSMPAMAITTTGSTAFGGCTGISTVTLLDGTSMNMGGEDFSGCTGIKVIRTEGAVTLGTRTFSGCTGLETVILSANTSFSGPGNDYTSAYYSFSGWTFQDSSNGVLNAEDTIKGHSYYRVDSTVMKQCYTVSFDVGGHADEIQPVVVPGTGQKISKPTANLHTGYEFRSDAQVWKYNGEAWDFDNDVVESDITLVADIVAKEYFVQIHAGDGAMPSWTSFRVHYGDRTFETHAGIVCRGYHIGGLTTGENGTGLRIADSDLNFCPNVSGYTDPLGNWARDDDNVELYVDWVADTYNVPLLSGTDPSADDGQVTFTYGSAVMTGYEPPAARNGYSIEGYYTTSDFDNGYKVIEFVDGQPSLVKGLSGYTDDNGAWINITPGSLYAKWEPKKVRIILDKNGGDADGSAVATVGSAELTGFKGVTRVGYVIMYYQYGGIEVIDSEGNLNNDATGFTDGDGNWTKFDVDELTLYAYWVAVRYYIDYDGNGGEGSVASREMYYNDPWPLMSDGFTRDNYTLVGWNTKADGTGDAYELGQEVTNLSLENNAIVTMYAQWEGNPYYVAFDGNGSTSGTMTNQTLHYAETANLTANAFSRTGYTFKEWTTNANGTGDKYADSAQVLNLVDADQTLQLYAQWTPITYHVTVDATPNLTGDYVMTVTYGSDTVTHNVPARCTGYHFIGIATAKGGNVFVMGGEGNLCKDVSGYTDADGKWTCYDDDLTLYAVFEADTYTMTLLKANDPGAGDGVAEIQYGGGVISFTPATNPGYTAEYYLDAQFQTKIMDADGILVNMLSGFVISGKWIAASGDSVFYAKWTPITYTVTLIAGEGGTNGTATVTYGMNNFTVTKEPVKNGYEVMQYWATDSGGTVAKGDGSLYSYAGWVTSLLKWCNSAENQSLYVNWFGKEYDVQFMSNGGNTPDFTMKIRYTHDVDDISVQKPTREGYNFLGYYAHPTEDTVWVFGNQGRAREYVNGWTTDGWANYSDEQILYAHWIALPTGIEIYDGDQTTEKWLTIYYDNTVTSGGSLPSAGVGYKIEGLYADKDCTIKVLNGDCHTVSGVTGWTDADGKWKVAEETTRLYVKYELKTTALILNSNGGEVNGSAVATYSKGTLTDYVPATRIGYTLIGYYKVQAFGSESDKVIDENGVICNASYLTDGGWNRTDTLMTLYAWWSINKYTITYDLGDGTDGTPVEYNYGVNVATPDDPEREGYTFAGWSPVIPTTMPAENITITALWAPNTYKITVDPNGGTGTFEFNVTYGTSNDVPYMTDAFSKVGHHIGYYLSVDISGYNELIAHETEVATGQDHYRFNGNVEGYTVIEDGMVKWVHAGDVTVSLSWSPNVYTGILSSDGYGTDGSFEVTYGFNTVNVVHASADGYDRAGYYTEPKGAGTFALTGEYRGTYNFAYNIPGITDAEGKWVYTGTEPVVLYSKWEPQFFPVTVDKNGGDQDGWYQATYKDDHFLVISQVTRQGATLTGIYADAACSADKQIADKDGRFLNVTVAGFLENGKWICLIDDVKTYAKWAVNPTPTNTDTVDFVDPTTDTVMIDMSSTAVSEAINDASKTEVKVTGDGWKMEIPKEILSGATGTVSIGAKTLSAEDINALPAEVKTLVEGKTVFSLSLTDSNGAVSFTGKKIKVSLPYTLKDGENASDVKVFYLDANNNPVAVDGVTYDATNKCAVFETDHFSNWYVDVIPDDSSSGGGINIGLIIGIVIGVLVLAGVGAFFFMKSKKA